MLRTKLSLRVGLMIALLVTTVPITPQVAEAHWWGRHTITMKATLNTGTLSSCTEGLASIQNPNGTYTGYRASMTKSGNTCTAVWTVDDMYAQGQFAINGIKNKTLFNSGTTVTTSWIASPVDTRSRNDYVGDYYLR